MGRCVGSASTGIMQIYIPVLQKHLSTKEKLRNKLDFWVVVVASDFYFFFFLVRIAEKSP